MISRLPEEQPAEEPSIADLVRGYLLRIDCPEETDPSIEAVDTEDAFRQIT